MDIHPVCCQIIIIQEEKISGAPCTCVLCRLHLFGEKMMKPKLFNMTVHIFRLKPSLAWALYCSSHFPEADTRRVTNLAHGDLSASRTEVSRKTYRSFNCGKYPLLLDNRHKTTKKIPSDTIYSPMHLLLQRTLKVYHIFIEDRGLSTRILPLAAACEQ
jgi:hypothetical protein